MRTVEIRYEILRGGAFFGYLAAPADAAPTLRMEAEAEIKTALSGTFGSFVTDADGSRVEPDWLSDEIRPVLVIDGEESALGTFAAAQVTPVDANGVESLAIEAFDRCWRVRDTKAESRVFFAAGTNYITAAEQLLVGSGIAVVLATPSSESLKEDREWDIGTSYLTIVNELLGEINYSQLYFTPEGFAVLRPATVPSAADLSHRISDDPDDLAAGADRIDALLPRLTRTTDVYSAPNVFVAWCANPEKTGNMVARAENNNPQSPLSISRRGRRIVQATRVDNIASQEELQAYADRQRNDSLIGGETLQITTALLPGYNVRDVVGLKYKDLSALCILQGYTMELRVGGSMQMTLQRVVYNFD